MLKKRQKRGQYSLIFKVNKVKENNDFRSKHFWAFETLGGISIEDPSQNGLNVNDPTVI